MGLTGAVARVRVGRGFVVRALGVVRAGAVRNGSAVVICCCEERKAMVLRPRDGGGVLLTRGPVPTSSLRGARVFESAPVVAPEFGRWAVVRVSRAAEVSNGKN